MNEYIEDHSHPVDHFWMAYPDASTTMVDQALKLKRPTTYARRAWTSTIRGASVRSGGAC